MREGEESLSWLSSSRRRASFIHGAEDDVRELATHLVVYLDERCRVGQTSSATLRDESYISGDTAAAEV
jgi:hypothetical protein